MKTPAPHKDTPLIGTYRDRSGKVYAASICPRRGLLLTRQLSDRLTESFTYDADEFCKQLAYGTFTRIPDQPPYS